MHSPRTTRFTRLLIPLLVGCLVVLFTAAAPRSQASASSIATSHALRPAISTSCPASGTARAAYMPSMTLGSHPTIVYIVNEGTFTQDWGCSQIAFTRPGTSIEILIPCPVPPNRV